MTRILKAEIAAVEHEQLEQQRQETQREQSAGSDSPGGGLPSGYRPPSEDVARRHREIRAQIDAEAAAEEAAARGSSFA